MTGPFNDAAVWRLLARSRERVVLAVFTSLDSKPGLRDALRIFLCIWIQDQVFLRLSERERERERERESERASQRPILHPWCGVASSIHYNCRITAFAEYPQIHKQAEALQAEAVLNTLSQPPVSDVQAVSQHKDRRRISSECLERFCSSPLESTHGFCLSFFWRG